MTAHGDAALRDGSGAGPAARCPVCGAGGLAERQLQRKAPTRNMTILTCGECDHAVLAAPPEHSQNLAFQSSAFDDRATGLDRRYLRWPRRPALLARQIMEVAGQPGRTLDVGCGNGYWLAALGPRWERHGIELSPSAASLARRDTGAQVFCGPWESFQGRPDSFDLVTAFAVIEHVSDPRAMVRWIHGMLKPGGTAVLMTGDRASRVALAMGDDWPLYWSEEHVSFFSGRSLRVLLEQEGLVPTREEWRFMYLADGLGTRRRRLWEKAREMLGLVTSPTHDHMYIYARKFRNPPNR